MWMRFGCALGAPYHRLGVTDHPTSQALAATTSPRDANTAAKPDIERDVLALHKRALMPRVYERMRSTWPPNVVVRLPLLDDTVD